MEDDFNVPLIGGDDSTSGNAGDATPAATTGGDSEAGATGAPATGPVPPPPATSPAPDPSDPNKLALVPGMNQHPSAPPPPAPKPAPADSAPSDEPQDPLTQNLLGDVGTDSDSDKGGPLTKADNKPSEDIIAALKHQMKLEQLNNSHQQQHMQPQPVSAQPQHQGGPPPPNVRADQLNQINSIGHAGPPTPGPESQAGQDYGKQITQGAGRAVQELAKNIGAGGSAAHNWLAGSLAEAHRPGLDARLSGAGALQGAAQVGDMVNALNPAEWTKAAMGHPDQTLEQQVQQAEDTGQMPGLLGKSTPDWMTKMEKGPPVFDPPMITPQGISRTAEENAPSTHVGRFFGAGVAAALMPAETIEAGVAEMLNPRNPEVFNLVKALGEHGLGKDVQRIAHAITKMGAGAAIYALQNAQQQLGQKGHIDPRELMAAAELGAGIGGGSAALRGVAKMLSPEEGQAVVDAGKDILLKASWYRQAKRGLMEAKLKETEIGQKIVKEVMAPAPPVTPQEKVQARAMDDVTKALQQLGPHPSLWAMNSPADFHAIGVLEEHGYMGYQGVHDAAKDHGYDLRSVLDRMKGKALPPTPQQLFQLVRQEEQRQVEKDRAAALNNVLKQVFEPTKPAKVLTARVEKNVEKEPEEPTKPEAPKVDEKALAQESAKAYTEMQERQALQQQRIHQQAAAQHQAFVGQANAAVAQAPKTPAAMTPQELVEHFQSLKVKPQDIMAARHEWLDKMNEYNALPESVSDEDKAVVKAQLDELANKRTKLEAEMWSEGAKNYKQAVEERTNDVLKEVKPDSTLEERVEFKKEIERVGASDHVQPSPVREAALKPTKPKAEKFASVEEAKEKFHKSTHAGTIQAAQKYLEEHGEEPFDDIQHATDVLYGNTTSGDRKAAAQDYITKNWNRKPEPAAKTEPAPSPEITRLDAEIEQRDASEKQEPLKGEAEAAEGPVIVPGTEPIIPSPEPPAPEGSTAFQEPNGIFGPHRHPLHDPRYLGREAGRHGLNPETELKGKIDDDLYDDFRKKLAHLNAVHGELLNAKDQAQLAAQDVYNLGNEAQRKDVVTKKVDSPFKSWAQQKIDKNRSDLTLADTEAEKERLNKEYAEALEAQRHFQEEAQAEADQAEKLRLSAAVEKAHASLQRLDNLLYGVNWEGKHPYTIAASDFSEFNKARHIPPKDYNEAINRSDEAEIALASIEQRWKDAKKDALPVLLDVEKVWRKTRAGEPNIEQTSPSWEGTAKLPNGPIKVQTTTTVHFNPKTIELSEEAQRAQKEYELAVSREEGSQHATTIYKRTNSSSTPVGPDSWKDPGMMKYLIDKGFSDGHQKGIVASAMLTIMGYSAVQAAQAEGVTDMTPKQQEAYWGQMPFWGYLGAGLLAYPIVRRFGGPAARALGHTATFFHGQLNKVIREHTVDADEALGITLKPLTLTGAIDRYESQLGTVKSNKDLAGLVKAVKAGKMDGRQLSPEGHQAVQFALQAEKEFKEFAGPYIHRWNKEYAAADPEKRAKYRGTNEVLRFLYASHVNPNVQIRGSLDTAFAILHRNAVAGMLMANPRNLLAAYVYDMFNHGPLVFGTKTYAHAFVQWRGNVGGVKDMVSHISLPGNYAQMLGRSVDMSTLALEHPHVNAFLQTRAGKAVFPNRDFIEKPFRSDDVNAQVGYISEGMKFFNDHDAEMKTKGIKDWKQFIKWTTEAPADDPVQIAFQTRVWSDVFPRAYGSRLSHTEQDLIQRNPIMGKLLTFVSGRLRESRNHNKLVGELASSLKGALPTRDHSKVVGLMFSSMAQKNFKDAMTHAANLLSFYGAKQQFGGDLLIPASLLYLGSNLPALQTFTSNVSNAMNRWSLGRALGGRNLTVGWDPLNPISQGMYSPVMQNFEDSMVGLNEVCQHFGEFMEMFGDVPWDQVMSNPGAVAGAISTNVANGTVANAAGDIMTGSSTIKSVAHARAVVKGMTSWMEQWAPYYLSVPSRVFGNFMNAYPDALNGEYTTSVPRIDMGGGARGEMQLESKHVYFAVPKGGPLPEAAKFLSEHGVPDAKQLYTTDDQGNTIESEEGMKAREWMDFTARMAGFKSATISEIQDRVAKLILSGQNKRAENPDGAVMSIGR